MSLKKILVHPDLLSLSGGGSKSTSANTKTRKQKPAGISVTQSNNVKKKLIARIQNFQQNPSATASTGASASAGTGAGTGASVSNSLTESIDFLNNLAREKEGKKREKKSIRRETLKHNRQPTDPSAYMSISTELPPELSLDTIQPRASIPTTLISPPKVPHVSLQAPHIQAPHVSAQAPPYSNLKKGGSKPTYRTWLRNTQKNKPTINVPAVLPAIRILDTEPEESNRNTNNEIDTNELDTNEDDKIIVNNQDDKIIVNTNDSSVPAPAPAPVSTPVSVSAPPPALYKPSFAQKRKRITRTLKYKLGKHANGTVSVLIKNSNTRRKIQNEQSLLKQKSILDIKNYLRKNNLLKAGTQAPNDVLRHLYEQSILAGQVENKSKENLIHNYFNNDLPNEKK